jgi:hypothetical protein
MSSIAANGFLLLMYMAKDDTRQKEIQRIVETRNLFAALKRMVLPRIIIIPDLWPAIILKMKFALLY